LRIAYRCQHYSLNSFFSFANFTALSLGSPACYFGRRFDYIDKLMIETLAPICFSILLLIVFWLKVFYMKVRHVSRRASIQSMGTTRMSITSEAGAVEEGDTSSNIRTGELYTQTSEPPQVTEADRKEVDEEIGHMITRYFSLFLLVTYLVLPSVTTRIAGVIPTVNIDPDGVTGLHYRFMRNDLSIATDSHRYRFGIIWASVFAFVYPVGVPLLYLYVLWYNRKAIRGLKDAVPKPKQAMRPKPPQKLFSIPVINDAGDYISKKDLTDSDAAEKASGKRCSWLRSCLVSNDKNIMDYITPESIYFLYGAYESQFFYWEVLETLRRILLTAVVSVISPGMLYFVISSFKLCSFQYMNPPHV
jgi:hypothetical protein